MDAYLTEQGFIDSCAASDGKSMLVLVDDIMVHVKVRPDGEKCVLRCHGSIYDSHTGNQGVIISEGREELVSFLSDPSEWCVACNPR